MGASKSKEISDLLERLQLRYGELGLEINSLRPARALDKQDIQALVRRLEDLQARLGKDMLLVIQHCRD